MVDTRYAPCACSPLGKMSAVSQPYAPGAAPVWTTYTYDASGNLIQVMEPGSLATLYTYDVLNHLTQVSMTRGSTTQPRTFTQPPLP